MGASRATSIATTARLTSLIVWRWTGWKLMEDVEEPRHCIRSPALALVRATTGVVDPRTVSEAPLST